LGVKAKSRKVVGNNGTYELREEQGNTCPIFIDYFGLGNENCEILV